LTSVSKEKVNRLPHSSGQIAAQQIKLVAVSLLATGLSLVILLFADSVAAEYQNRAPQIVIDTERVYTLEEVEASAARALENIQLQIEEAKAASNGSVMEDYRVLVSAFIWIPWAIVPYVFGVTNRITAALLLLPSVALSYMGVFTLLELALCFIATNIQGYFKNKRMAQR
jgi:hypothetical protein